MSSSGIGTSGSGRIGAAGDRARFLPVFAAARNRMQRRRKAGAFQSAMSMLNFYINRAGRNLPDERTELLSRAKDALGRLFGRA
jgi:hypothetical protein